MSIGSVLSLARETAGVEAVCCQPLRYHNMDQGAICFQASSAWADLRNLKNAFTIRRGYQMHELSDLEVGNGKGLESPDTPMAILSGGFVTESQRTPSRIRCK